MSITASRLRENIYRVLDGVIETGRPVEIVRRGKVLRIVPEKPVSKLANLKKCDCFVGDPDDIIGMDWSKEWSELK
jgi:prevent-host-death family protein